MMPGGHRVIIELHSGLAAGAGRLLRSAAIVALLLVGVTARAAEADTSTLTHAVITTDASVEASCTYPDVDPCDDNDGGWRGTSWHLAQTSSGNFELAQPVPADDMERVPVVMTGSSHSYEATMNYTSAFCTQKQVTKDGGVSGGSDGLQALFVVGETTDPLDPKVSLRTARDLDMDGVAGAQPTVARTTTTTSNNHESCPPGEERRDVAFAAALDPLVDPFLTSDLKYDQTVSPQTRTVDCPPDQNQCKVTILGGETWSATGKSVGWGEVTKGSKTVSWLLQFTVERAAPACSDGRDNDGDGLGDHPSDPGCDSRQDVDEHGSAQCDNGIDDDGDGFIDTPGGDLDCQGPLDDDEGRPCAPVRTVYPAFTGRFWGRKISELTWEATVGFCSDGQRVQLRGVKVSASTKKLGHVSYRASLERTLRNFVDITVEWKSSRDDWRFVEGSRPEEQLIELSGGKVQACYSLPSLGPVAKVLRIPLLKNLSSLSTKAKRKVLRKLNGRLRARLDKRLKGAAKHEYKRVYRQQRSKGATKAVARREARAAKKRLKAHHKFILEFIDESFEGLIDGQVPRPCHDLWTPRVRIRIPAAANATWWDAGVVARPALWEVVQVR